MKDLRQFIKTTIRDFLNEDLSSNDIEEYIEQLWFYLDHCWKMLS